MDQSWHNVREAIVRLQHQVEDARALLPDLRRRYLAARQDLKDAKAKVAELVKKIKDLQAQGVECGLA
jgi:predicted  nucleic acid-binding Zn-ribbon protein